MPAMRLFVAAPVPAAAVAAATAAARPFLDLPSARPVADGLHHATVRFLGDVREEDLPGIVDSIAGAAARVAPGEAGLRDLGTFPAGRRAAVLWAGMTGAEPLVRLAVSLRSLPGDDRGFLPHVTLARFDPPTRLGHLPGGAFGDAFPLDRVRLVRSSPGPGGPRYDPVSEFPLGG